MAVACVVLPALYFLVLLALGHYVYKLWARKRLRMPPGPFPLPIVGNIFDLPRIKPWEVYRELSAKYGSELLFMDLPNQPTIVLNSTNSILSLMEGHAKTYASKAEAVMDGMTGWDWNLGIMPYGQRWRRGRRLFHQYFNQNAVKKYRSIQTREVQHLLKRAAAATAEDRLLDSQNIRQTLAAIVLDITYGMQIQNMHHEYFSLARIAVQAIDIYRFPGNFWIEFFPWLRYVPAWVPGSKAQQFASQYAPTINALRDQTFEEAVESINRGDAGPSITQSLVEKLRSIPQDTPDYREFEQSARDATAVAFAAGADTSSFVLFTMLLGIIIAPRVQNKAHQELDAIVGPGRLPTPEDMSSLPYLQAIFMEALRWKPVLPLSTPRRTMFDDEYMGYSIPAGTVIIPNVWSLLFDEERYPNAREFIPERFIRDGKLDLRDNDPTVAFGFGRRICPGRHLAKDTLLLIMASVLHVFNIEPAMEHIPQEMNTGFVSIPDCPPCRLIPRSPGAMDVINAC